MAKHRDWNKHYEEMNTRWQQDCAKWGEENADIARRLLRTRERYESDKEYALQKGQNDKADGFQMWIDEINVKLAVLRLGK